MPPLKSKRMGLEDEATTEEMQSPGWSGTKEEFGSDGTEADVTAKTENIHQSKMLQMSLPLLSCCCKAGATTLLQREI